MSTQLAQRVGFWRATPTAARLAFAAAALTIVLEVAALIVWYLADYSLGPAAPSGDAAVMINVVAATLPMLLVVLGIQALIGFGLRSGKSGQHLIAVIAAGLIGLLAGGLGVMQSVFMATGLIDGTLNDMSQTLEVLALLAALAITGLGALYLLAAVIGWREMPHQARVTPAS